MDNYNANYDDDYEYNYDTYINNNKYEGYTEQANSNNSSYSNKDFFSLKILIIFYI